MLTDRCADETGGVDLDGNDDEVYAKSRVKRMVYGELALQDDDGEDEDEDKRGNGGDVENGVLVDTSLVHGETQCDNGAGGFDDQRESLLLLEEVVDELSFHLPLAFFGGAIYGYNVSAGAYLEDCAEHFDLDSGGKELISAAATITDAITMGICGAYLLSRFGRRKLVMFGGIVSLVGAILGCLSRSLGQLVAARLFGGIGNGISILCVPMLLAETTTTEKRGVAITWFQIGVVAGFSVPYPIQIASDSWRVTIGLGGVPGLMAFLILLLAGKASESHAWKKWKIDRGVTSMETEEILGSGARINPPVGHVGEVRGLRGSCCSVHNRGHDDGNGLGFKASACLGVVLAFTNNSSDAIVFYGPTIVQMTGLGNEYSLWTAFGLAIISLPAVLLVLALEQRLPRRKLILSGLFGVCCAYLIVSISFLTSPRGKPVLVTFGFLLLTLSYQVGPGTLFIIILPELFHDSKDRARGMSIGTMSMSIFSIVCNGSMLSTIDLLGPGGCFLTYGLAYVLCWIILSKFLPETKANQTTR